MKKFFVTAFALPFIINGCTVDTAGTTEEENAIAFWNEDTNLEKWVVTEGEGVITLDKENKDALAGRVALGKPAPDGLARAGLEYDVSKSDGTPGDLSATSKGLCVAYQSDLDVEIQLDMGGFVNEAVDEDLPYVSMHKTMHGVETHCHRWAAFKQKLSDELDGEIAAMSVLKVRMVFVGESGETGKFSIDRVGRYEDGSDFYSSSEEPQSSSSESSSSAEESSSSEELSSSSLDSVEVNPVRKYGSAVQIVPAITSQFKMDSTFLWDSVDSTSVDSTIQWFVDFNGDSTSLKILEESGFVGAREGNTTSIPSIGFNVYKEEDLLADISAWGGFCVRYKSSAPVHLALVGDVNVDYDYWFVELMPTENMVWAKIGWDVFDYYDNQPNDGIASAIGRVAQVKFMFPEQGDFAIEAIGSYDQCGN